MTEKIFSVDAAGQPCVTPEGLDMIWPKDDREPAEIFLKGGVLPPTCGTSLADRYTDEQLLNFFDDNVPTVPLPPASALLATAIVAIYIWRKI